MNPFDAMQLKSKIERFERQHPKVVAFLAENHQELKEGAIIDFRIRTTDGRNVVTNFRLSAEDEDTINLLKKLLS
ncbi:MAG: hypothetical protein IJM25_00265 [Eubacterium sp.]|jgi:hypothetical protein|nr:hypothetical protein [Eubacterium sp.]